MNRIILIFRFTVLILFLVGFISEILAQYPWPVTPINQTHDLTGTFCEFRDTGSSDHFHNGVDIPKADGSPVYPVEDGAITYIEAEGSNAYVRVGRFCYLHIRPNPSLSEGDYVVKSQTVLGTIISGMGHIHFIDGKYDSEINAVRKGGGLTPYQDIWAPKITFVKFFQDRTDNEFSSGVVSGKVDIIVKVEERNGPPGSSYSRLNNGTYKLGFKILSESGDSVVYTPTADGIRFQFDNKPSNSYVHNVFYKRLSSTSSHVYIVTNKVHVNSFWDTRPYSPGRYQVMIFAEDTRNNTDTVYVPIEVEEQDVTPPSPPRLKYLKRIGDGFQLAWYPNEDDDLSGYRLYYSNDAAKWSLIFDEDDIPPDSTTKTFKTLLSAAIYLKLSAVDNAAVPNESEPSDIYGISTDRNASSTNVLIVDGFDRTEMTGGAWQNNTHPFAFTYGQAVAANGVAFDCCSNDAVMDGNIMLSNYLAVIWFVGDEAETDETFSATEQNILRSYLYSNGRLFISGSNIAWDLDLDSDCYSTTEEDNDFLQNILGIGYAGKVSPDVMITGQNGDYFSEFEFILDRQIYPVDSLDIIQPKGTSRTCIRYNSSETAGIMNDNANGGRLIFFAFPFELINSEIARTELMGKILDYLSILNSVDDHGQKNQLTTVIPERFILEQNYPNPFHHQTTVRIHIPKSCELSLNVFNLLGQQVKSLLMKNVAPGLIESRWDGRNDQGRIVPNGIYFYVLETEDIRLIKKVLFLRN